MQGHVCRTPSPRPSPNVGARAAQKLGLSEAPVHVAPDLTPAQVRAYRLLDNRSHEETAWDEGLLGLELVELKGLDFDLELTGFELDEIKDLVETDVDTLLKGPYPSRREIAEATVITIDLRDKIVGGE